MQNDTNCPVPCIQCGKVLLNYDQSPRNHPSGGLEFNTHGHYGSTVFDPSDGSSLIINICDACVQNLAHKQGVLFSKGDNIGLWNPDSD